MALDKVLVLHNKIKVCRHNMPILDLIHSIIFTLISKKLKGQLQNSFRMIIFLKIKMLVFMPLVHRNIIIIDNNMLRDVFTKVVITKCTFKTDRAINTK